MTAPILFSEKKGRGGQLGIVTLNRPQALNALNEVMVTLLSEQLHRWAHQQDIKAVIIQAAPGRAFCAGGDLRAVYPATKTHNLAALQFFRQEYHLNQQIFHYPKPYIAILDGITMGGGAGISLHGSHRVGTEHLTFAMPETSIGFYPDVGGTYFLPRLPEKFGIFLGLTGQTINVQDCADLGLIQHQVKRAQCEALITALADSDFQQQAHDAVTQVIQQFHANQLATATLSPLREQVQAHFKYDTVEEIMASLANESNKFTDETHQRLLSKSPTSLKVTLRALQQGKMLSFDDCMQQEFRLTSRAIFAPDFAEGIRAVIIDKDQRPKWQPATLEAVNENMVNQYFQALAAEL